MTIATRIVSKTLTTEKLQKIHAYWRAANYLSVDVPEIRNWQWSH